MMVENQDLANHLGIYDSTLAEEVITERILRNVRGIYSWVVTRTLQYRFPGCDELKTARAITVRPTSWESLCHFVTRIWLPSSCIINHNRVVAAIFGSGNSRDVAHLQAAAQRNWMITVYLSLDRENFDATFTSPSSWCAIM